MIITVVVAACALAGGIAANRFLHRRVLGDDEEGMSVRDLVAPMQTLTILLLAFVLAMASSSHGKADEAARTEAGILDHMGEVAVYAPKAQRERIQADVICYARAVRKSEWPALAGGHGSSVPNVWSAEFRHILQEIPESGPSFGMLISADDQRSKARSTRIAESSPAIPSTIYWFMMTTLTVTIVALGLCLPRRNNRPQLVALFVVTVLLTSALLIIRDIERPFDGWVKVDPTAIGETESQTVREYHETYGAHRLPCDEAGRKRV